MLFIEPHLSKKQCSVKENVNLFKAKNHFESLFIVFTKQYSQFVGCEVPKRKVNVFKKEKVQYRAVVRANANKMIFDKDQVCDTEKVYTLRITLHLYLKTPSNENFGATFPIVLTINSAALEPVTFQISVPVFSGDEILSFDMATDENYALIHILLSLELVPYSRVTEQLQGVQSLKSYLVLYRVNISETSARCPIV